MHKAALYLCSLVNGLFITFWKIFKETFLNLIFIGQEFLVI